MRKVVRNMNVYDDDVISLSEDSARELLTTLLFDDSSLSLRNEFISDVQNNVSFLDNGNLIVDVPDVELIECENYEPINTIVGTKEIRISIKSQMAIDTHYQGMAMHSYHQNERNNKTKYVVKHVAPLCHWQTNTKMLEKAS